MADIGELQHPATPLAYRHASAEQLDGAVVFIALSHAAHLPIEERILILVLKPYE